MTRLPAFLGVELDLDGLLRQLARLVPRCIGKSTAFTPANVQSRCREWGDFRQAQYGTMPPS